MRRFMLAAAAVAVLASTGSLVGTRAEAMPLAGAGLAGSVTTDAEQVYLRCSRFWNGWRWVRRCVEVGGGPAYGPGPGYGYGWRPRPRFYGYY